MAMHRRERRQAECASSNEIAHEILRVSTEGKLTLFVGSFVSVRAPTGLPMAAELKQAILATLWRECRSRLSPALTGPPSSTLRRSQWSELPLEILMEEVLSATGVPVDRLLSFLSEAVPNRNHAVLARLLDQVSTRLVTTNFDELIEAARSVPGDRQRLSKPHGTISNPSDMTIQLTQVGRRIVSARKRSALELDLSGRDVCFIGYSGRDLDIQPLLRSAPIRSVLWITKPPLEGESTIERDRIRGLFGADTPVRCVAADADVVFDVLGHALSISVESSDKSHRWRRLLVQELSAIPWNQQADAAGRILRLSGRPKLAADVYARLERAPLPKPDIAKATLNRAQALYAQQKFGEARQTAQRAVAAFRRLEDAEGQARGYNLLALIIERSSERISGWALRYLKMSIDLHPSPRSRTALGAHLDFGISLKNRGRFEQAEQAFFRGLTDARVLGDLDAQMRFRMCVGILRGTERHEALIAGDLDAASRLARSARYHLRRSQEAARFFANIADELRALSALIALDLDRGLRRRRLGTAGDLLDEAERLVPQSPELDQRWSVASMRGDWLNQMGRGEEAVALLTRAIENARKVPFVFAALRERGRAFAALGNVQAAEEDFARAVALAPSGPHRGSATELLAMARSQHQSS